MTTKVILDVDTGTDDAVAVILAALHPDIDLVGVSTVWGNLPIENTTDNTLRVLDFIGKSEIPVHRGLGKPFAPHPFSEYSRTRASGHEGSKERMHPPALDLPAPTSSPQAQGAVEWLVKTIRESVDPITVVPVGPLTNIAAAITIAPDIVPRIAVLVIMGGANEFGNVTPGAEGNIWCDPIAADVVFSAGLDRLVLVPLDATHKANISSEQAKAMVALGTPAGRAAGEAIEQRIVAHDATQPQPIPHTAAVHDPLCIAYLIDPTVVSLEHLHVAVDTTSIRSVGRTVIDIRRRGFEPPNAYVALDADGDLFYKIMMNAFAKQDDTSR
jgi:purine nucleosidase/ribosylpyrimidine nucleosidase